MAPTDPEPNPVEPASAPDISEPKKARRSTPRKPAVTPESALPSQQAIKTTTEVQLAEHPDERASRLKRVEQDKDFEIYKNKTILRLGIGVVVATLITSVLIIGLSIVGYSIKPELLTFATSAFTSVLTLIAGYVTGKADSKKPDKT